MKKISFLILIALLGVAGMRTSLAAQESPESPIGGLFSVSADKQVRFSKGNLQCTINGTDTAWAFAAHQYDVLGTANVNGSALANTIDLFGWSGSTGSAKWGISTSDNWDDYSGGFADWGQNIGDGNTWRTLTNDEWTYLRSTRANASNLIGVARINLDEAGTTYANGLILLPDTWTCPEDITFKSGFSSNYGEQAYADYQTFTLEQWQKLESAGAVFLPASGNRFGTSFDGVQYYGSYWFASGGYGFADKLDFCSAYADLTSFECYVGKAVRLVQDTYTVTATCDAEQGSVSGAGAHPRGKEVTLTATAAEGYYFLQWSDGTTSNPYTFTLTQDTALTAVFAANPMYNAVGGLFSVGEGKQVLFSAGNLQYTQSANVWAFAAHQYDMLGTANVNGSALANTIDLFGWSGSTGAAKWGISTSTDNNDYSGDFADWGQNIGDGTTWRTLTHDEWTYLRSTRANAASLMGVARINLDAAGTTYANGLILLPDTWTCPEGVTFTSGFSSTDDSEQAYADYQTFTLEQWATLEASGAVFLPASGGRSGSSFYDVQHFGYYNSATPYSSGYAYSLYFVSDFAGRTYGNRSYGRAVRLVQDTYTVTATCDAEQGSVSGAGTYPNGTQVTLTATAAEHYHFVQWSKGETANPYTLTLAGDTTINAVFAIDQHTVTASGEHGSVTGTGTYDYGTEVTLTADADAHYHFVQWNNGETANPYTLTLAGDTTITAVFAINQYTVTASGEHGSVTGAGTYDYGTMVTMTADADAHYHFVQWSNGETANPYTFTLASDTTLTAVFALDRHTVTASGEHGSVTGAGTYDYGTMVTLTVDADAHYHFVQWSNGEIVNPYTFTLAGDTTITAVFAIDQHTVTVNGEHGTVAGAGTYDYGAQVTLTADADAHYHFVQWSNGKTANPYTFILAGDTILTAVFAIDQHTVTASGENGTVTGAGTYNYGTEVTLEATADAHYHFVQWSNGEIVNPYTFTLAGDTTITAVFAIDQHTVTASGENGTVTGAGTYNYGAKVTLTADADAHYHFVQWSNGEIVNPYTFTLAGDTTINAVFAIDQHTVTVSGENGTVTGADTYDYGAQVTLTADADAHYHFVQWSNGETANPYTFILAGDTILTAVFAIDQHTVTAGGENGSVTGAGTYNYEAQVTLTADADAHYHFVQWSDGETANPYTLTLAGDTIINAVFAIDQHTVTASGENGTVTGAGTYDYGTKVTLEATADEHYHFVQWSNGETANPYTLTLAGDTTITAVFAIDRHTVTASGEHGTVAGAGTYDYGTMVTLAADADAHYHFVQWSNGETANPYTLTLAGDTTITAVFAIDRHTVTASGEHGTVAGAGTYDYGTMVTLTADADAHYHFVQWSDGETANPYTLTLAGDTIINAVFAIDQHMVTVSGEHGSVTGAGTYDYGTTVTMTADADAHYHFVQWSDGETANPYTFILAGDTTINAVFAIDQHTVTVSGENGTVTGAGTYDYGTEVTLEATADEHYHFVQWSDGNTDNPRIFLLVEDIILTAEFAEDISEQTTSEIKTLKVLRNGLIFIIRDDKIYDLTGRPGRIAY